MDCFFHWGTLFLKNYPILSFSCIFSWKLGLRIDFLEASQWSFYHHSEKVPHMDLQDLSQVSQFCKKPFLYLYLYLYLYVYIFEVWSLICLCQSCYIKKRWHLFFYFCVFVYFPSPTCLSQRSSCSIKGVSGFAKAICGGLLASFYFDRLVMNGSLK